MSNQAELTAPVVEPQIVMEGKVTKLKLGQTTFNSYRFNDKDHILFPLDSIVREKEMNPRAILHDETINEYAEAINEGAKFPPVVVGQYKDMFYMIDGFHRAAAFEKLAKAALENKERFTFIPVIVRQLTSKKHAFEIAVGSNTTHGLRRSIKDKKHALKLLLEDTYWRAWVDTRIAKMANVSPTFVANMRNELGFQVEERTTMDSEGNLKTISAPQKSNSGEKKPTKIAVSSTEAGISKASHLMAEKAVKDVEVIIDKTAVTNCLSEAHRRLKHSFESPMIKQILIHLNEDLTKLVFGHKISPRSYPDLDKIIQEKLERKSAKKSA